MKFGKLVLVAALTTSSVAGLSACKKLSDAVGGNGANTASIPGAPGSSANAKLDAYADAYNKLIDTFGLEEEYKSYREADIAKKSPTDSISVSNGWIEKGRDKLKEARAQSGDVPKELDAAADKLLAALDKVVSRINGLNTYYSSKAYREDGLARGKREDSLMLADFAAADNALAAFNTILDHELTRRDEAVLARLKEGNPLLYDTKLAISQAKGVLGTFHGQADLTDPAKLKAADAKISQLEQTLAVQRAEADKEKASGKTPAVEHELINSSLTTMIGAYRDVKQSRNPGDFKRVVENYNDAVNQANDISDR